MLYPPRVCLVFDIVVVGSRFREGENERGVAGGIFASGEGRERARCCEEEVVAEAAVMGFYGEGFLFFVGCEAGVVESGFVGFIREVRVGVLGRGFSGRRERFGHCVCVCMCREDG